MRGRSRSSISAGTFTPGNTPIRFHLVVIDSGDAFAESWQHVTPDEYFSDRYSSAYPLAQVLIKAARSSKAQYLIVARNPSLVPSATLFDSIRHAVDDLEARGLSWLIASGGGMGRSGRRYIACYSHAEPCLRSGGQLAPLVDIFPDLYVVNLRALARLPLEEIRGLRNDSIEFVLTVLGYLGGQVTVFHPQLSGGVESRLTRDATVFEEDVRAFFAGRILDERVSTLLGDVAVGQARRDMARPSEPVLLEEAIRNVADAAAHLPSFSVLVRTRFQRRHLLARALVSLARAAAVARADVECILSTDIEETVARTQLEELERKFPSLRLVLCRAPAGEIPSRTANLMNGIRVASKDYVWIVDDDDYLSVTAFEDLRTAFFAGERPFVVTSTNVYRESWTILSSDRAVRNGSTYERSYESQSWARAFRGVNPLPICGYLTPTALLKKRVSQFPLRHDLSEDYALLLLVLTSPELPQVVEISAPTCNISLRDGGDNVVTMQDRRPWLRDVTAFLDEMQNDEKVASQGQWQLLQMTSGMTEAEALALREEVAQARRRIAGLGKELDQAHAEIRGLRSLLSARLAMTDNSEAPERRLPTGRGVDERSMSASEHQLIEDDLIGKDAPTPLSTIPSAAE